MSPAYTPVHVTASPSTAVLEHTNGCGPKQCEHKSLPDYSDVYPPLCSTEAGLAIGIINADDGKINAAAFVVDSLAVYEVDGLQGCDWWNHALKAHSSIAGGAEYEVYRGNSAASRLGRSEGSVEAGGQEREWPKLTVAILRLYTS